MPLPDRGTILLGYDVESASDSTRGFLQGARQLHQKYDVPWTIYLTGQTLTARVEDVREVIADPLLTVGQHTYNHVLLKSIYMHPGDGQPVHGRSPNFFHQGGTLEQVREEIDSTQTLIEDLLQIECQGLTGPWGYYRGLVDRPDILQILADNSIQWIRTNARDYRDCQPTPFSEQPFFYTDQGFEDILELGVQGYQDDFYWDRFDDRQYGESYQDYLFAMLEKVGAEDLVWNVCSHDHGTVDTETFFQTKGKWIEELIAQAMDLGIRFASPPQVYAEMKAAVRPSVSVHPPKEKR